ncbi:unnamed protein product, partial [Heterosigma akashiwo]
KHEITIKEENCRRTEAQDQTIMAHDGPVYAFVAEWFDPMPQLTKQYLLRYYPDTHEVDMVDGKSRRLFLKKSKVPTTILPQEFFVGSRMVLYSRNLNLVDYGDEKTRKIMSEREVKSVVILTPDAYEHFGKLLDVFLQEGLTLGKLKMFKLGGGEAGEVAGLLAGALPDGCDPRAFQAHLASNVGVAAVLLGENAVGRGRDLAADLRVRYGGGGDRVAVLAAEDGGSAAALADYFFGAGSRLASTATFDSCTACVVRPHAVARGLTGRVLDDVLAQGYEVSALEMFTLERPQAEEFLEVYKGVLPEWADAVDQLCAGACVAMEVRAEDPVATFRQTAGPWDVEMARDLRPATLRAKYGEDRVRNAVHCTDLPEDGVPECQYFFDLLQRQQI